MKKAGSTRFLFWILLGVSGRVNAQITDSVASALSAWQRVQIQRSAVALSSAGRIIAVNEAFTDNRNHWPSGEVNGFAYGMGKEGYSIRRIGKRNGKSGRAFIDLPDSVNLNQASTFIIEVDMVVPPGTAPEGGLLVGVRDKANYGLFVLTGQTGFMVKRVSDGATSDAYRSGDYSPTGNLTASDKTRHTLRVAKHDGQLFFAINGQETPGDAITFRKFPGNGIGFISAAGSTTFQNLRITVGMP